MLNRKLLLLTVSPVLLLMPTGWAADSASDALKTSGNLERLTKQTGVYNASKTGKTPGFFVDPTWPQPPPHNWLLGQIGGLYVDQHDNIWVYQRPRTLLNDEAGLETALPGTKDQKGQPINGLGQPRVYGAMEDCCKAAPSVFDSIPMANCCAPGAVHPTLDSSAANARRKPAASGQRANTASTSIRRTTCGLREMALPPRAAETPLRRIHRGRRIRMEATGSAEVRRKRKFQNESRRHAHGPEQQ